MFAGTGINITTEGRKHLDAALGSRSYLEQYVGGKVEDWVGEVKRLADVLIPSPIGRNCSEEERDLVVSVRMGGLGLINHLIAADAEYSPSIWVSAPLVSKIEAQSHETPEEAEVPRLVYTTRKEKDDGLKEELEDVKAMLPDKTQRAVDLACEKGASNWLTVIPLKDLDLISTSGNSVML